jgi:magnesium-transporting ATPase (P-type)
LTTIVERAPSTLEVQITRIVRVITAIALTMGTTVFLLSYYLIGMGVKESFIFAIGIIVANVPEGLLPTVTLTKMDGQQIVAANDDLAKQGCRVLGIAVRQGVVTGDGLEHFSDAQLRQLLKYRTGLVFARMSPEHKLRLVQTYKSLGYIVAVTGDGVNDAPALRAGNIGIAMGMNGTDVAREAADIVLTDDNFATIVHTIEEGRSVYQNIRKFMTYILASNIPEIIPFLAMVLFKIPHALTILQILAIDLGTDLLPALALGAESPEPGIMNHPPRSPQQKLLNRSLLIRAYGFLGAIEAVLSLLGFFKETSVQSTSRFAKEKCPKTGSKSITNWHRRTWKPVIPRVIVWRCLTV